MAQPKLTSNTLRGFKQELFAVNSDPAFGPAWMWVWNDTLTKEDLHRQVGDMRHHGACTLMPIPEPKEFRPTSMITRLSPEYLSHDYLLLYRYMVDQARASGADVWLYDEGGWPSGMVCWSLPAKYPQFRAQVISQSELSPAKGDTVTIPTTALCAFMSEGDQHMTQLEVGSSCTVKSDHVKILIYSVDKVSSYTDLLNPKATQQFIDMTHNKYYAAFGEYFAQVVSAVFSDEPKILNRAWSDGFAEDFQRQYGYDITTRLYALFTGDTLQDQQTRIDYADYTSQRWADNYFGVTQNWCHKHNTLFLCHLENDESLANHVAYNKNPLRQYRQMDIPAIDVIWRQIFPGCATSYFPKFASSPAHQQGKPRVCSESFCVYGNGLTPEQMKWVINYQYVRGINSFVFGGYQYSTKEFFQAGERPIFGPGDPLWKRLGGFYDYVTRTNYLLSLGQPRISTALYVPFRDFWAKSQSTQLTDDIAVKMLESQCDFDLIDDDLLMEQTTRITKNTLKAGVMSYTSVVVPKCSWMKPEALEKLAQFAKSGGNVIWIDDSRNQSPIAHSKSASVSNFTKWLTPCVKTEPNNTKLRVCNRKLSNGSLYLVTNEDTKPIATTLEFAENLPMIMLDLETGICRKPQNAHYSSGHWSLKLELPFAGACAVLFTKSPLHLQQPLRKRSLELADMSSGWSARAIRSHSLGRADYEVTDLSSTRNMPIELGNWHSLIGNEFSGDVEYTLQFTVNSDITRKQVLLDLGDVKYACRSSLNGH